MPGGNDPDSRRMMRFENLSEEESTLKDVVERLIMLRRNTMALMYGEFYTLLLTENTYAYCRTYFNEIVIIVMNKGAQTKNLTFDLPERFADIEVESQFRTMPGIRKGKMSVTLGGKSFDILTIKPL
jgi:glycosidase